MNDDFNAKMFFQTTGNLKKNSVGTIIIQGDKDSPENRQTIRLFTKGAQLFEANDLAGALNCYKQVLGLNPGVGGVYYAMAFCHARLGQLEHAKQLLRLEIEQPSYHPNAKLMLKDVQARMPDETLKQHVKTVSQQAGHIKYHPIGTFSMRGDINAPKNQKAVALYREALRHFEQGALIDSIRYFDQILKSGSDIGWIHYALGVCFARLGQTDTAQKALRFEMGSPNPHPDAARLLQDIRMRTGAYRNPTENELKVVLGAGLSQMEGWILTDIDKLNILREEQWNFLFQPNSISNLLSEHVLEHLTEAEVRLGLTLAHKYLKVGGKIRIAVPDAYRKDEVYVKEVIPPKCGHKTYWNYKVLSALMKEIGFDVRLLEYFDENEKFNYTEWDENEGKILRSKKFDKREKFKKGDVFYTSLIVDGIKRDTNEIL